MSGRRTQADPTNAMRLEDLMQRAQQGDARAYYMLLLRLSQRLRRMTARRAPWLAPEDIEDVVQEILLSVHQARATWDPARPFMPWVAAIARSRLADHVRSDVRRTAIARATTDLAVTFQDPRANHEAETVVNLLSMRKALLDLTPAEKQAVDHLRLRELSLLQAARTTGRTVPAMKVAIHRAMRKLKSILWKG